MTHLVTVAKVARTLLLMTLFSWVWVPAVFVYAVVWFAVYGWGLADDLFAVI